MVLAEVLAVGNLDTLLCRVDGCFVNIYLPMKQKSQGNLGGSAWKKIIVDKYTSIFNMLCFCMSGGRCKESCEKINVGQNKPTLDNVVCSFFLLN